jgi:hypothetical protein
MLRVAQVWRRVATTAVVIGSLSVVLGYISSALSLEKVQFLDDILVFQNHSLCQRLKCLGVAACLWLGDNIDCLW